MRNEIRLKKENHNTFICLAVTTLLLLALVFLLEYVIKDLGSPSLVARDLRRSIFIVNIAVWCYYFLPKISDRLFNYVSLSIITTLIFNLIKFLCVPERDLILAHGLCSVVLCFYCVPARCFFEMGLLNSMFVLYCYSAENKTVIGFFITSLICVGIAVLAYLLMLERNSKKRHTNLLWRKKFITYMITRKLEKLVHGMSDENITQILTERVKAVFPKNELAKTEQMAGFSFQDYRTLLDVSTETKHKIDEIIAIVAILKKSMRDEGLSDSSFPEEKMGTLLTNYKHSLSREENKKINFKLPNHDFKVRTCAPLFNYILDMLVETIFEQSEAKDIDISFDVVARKLYLTHTGARIPEHVYKEIFRKAPKKISSKHPLGFVATVLNDANISINYCQIETEKAGFLIKFPLLK
ncbi:MAG: hypothetical protein ACPGC9_00850 [Cytophagales bacterium]